MENTTVLLILVVLVLLGSAAVLVDRIYKQGHPNKLPIEHYPFTVKVSPKYQHSDNYGLEAMIKDCQLVHEECNDGKIEQSWETRSNPLSVTYGILALACKKCGLDRKVNLTLDKFIIDASTSGREKRRIDFTKYLEDPVQRIMMLDGVKFVKA